MHACVSLHAQLVYDEPNNMLPSLLELINILTYIYMYTYKFASVIGKAQV